MKILSSLQLLNHMFPTTQKKIGEKERKQPNLFNLIANMSHKKLNWQTYQKLEHKLVWSWVGEGAKEYHLDEDALIQHDVAPCGAFRP